MNPVQETIRNQIAQWVAPLGYEIVDVEFLVGPQKILRVYIDLPQAVDRRVGVEDCARVSHTLDQPLDALSEIESVFQGPYELEVSSPGINRPLKSPRDFERFAGSEARIHTFRPLTPEELENPAYQAKNPRQKSFFGILKGFKNEKIQLDVDPTGSAEGKKSAKRKKTAKAPSYEAVRIPIALITKAHLEPPFEEELLNPGRKK